jgi:hypothetical protein
MQRLQARQDVGPLDNLGTNKYKFSSLNYPSDIESLSHAMLFNILIQDATKDRDAGKAALAPSGSNGQPVGSRTAELNKGNFLGLTRRTKRSTTAISLYVPETVVFDNKQTYQQMNMLDTLGIGGTLAATGLSKAAGAMNITSGAGALGATLGSSLALAGVSRATSAAAGAAEGLARRLGAFGNVVGAAVDATKVSNLKTAANMIGFAVNPVIEVLYSSPVLRSFNFDFVFAPRSAEEANDVWSIIYQFRRHSAPELIASGVMFVPPSEFEITFLRKTGAGFAENTNMPRIASCVLEDIQVDYASAGSFVTFTDGMPVQIRMRLQFKELNIITREAIDKGY